MGFVAGAVLWSSGYAVFGLRAPLHPAVVHFPIALLVVAWVCYLLRSFTGDQRWGERARWLEFVGAALLPATIALGFYDIGSLDFIRNPRWDLPLIWHAITAAAAAAVFLGHFLMQRVRPQPPGRQVLLDIGLTTSGVWLLTLAGLIAGEMVYAL
jgi:uncharacterized membrane protein